MPELLQNSECLGHDMLSEIELHIVSYLNKMRTSMIRKGANVEGRVYIFKNSKTKKGLEGDKWWMDKKITPLAPALLKL